MRKEGPGSPITGRSAQRQRSGGKPAGHFPAVFGRLGSAFRSGAAQDAPRSPSAPRDGLGELGERVGRIGALPMAASSRAAASATRKSADRPRRALQRMRQRRASAGMAASVPIESGRLGRKHRQHLLLEAGIAERHALEMVEIDRTVIGSERRRWHPFYPFEMKRHGSIPDLPAALIPAGQFSASQSRNWLTERSVGLAASSPCF